MKPWINHKPEKMHTVIRAALLLAIVAVMADGQTGTRRLRKKAECPPAFKVTIRQGFPSRPNFFRGTCETRGAQRDTCRKRMSCCENSEGDMICVRARVYFPKNRQQALPPPDFPPMPPMDNIMQNDVEIRNPLCPPPHPLDKPCIGDVTANFCVDDFACSEDRICCPDPCPSDLLPTNLCLRPIKAAGNFPLDNFPSLTDSFPPPVPIMDGFLPPLPTVNSFQSKISTVDSFNQPTAAKTTSVTESEPATTQATEKDIPQVSHPSCPKQEVPKNCNEDGTMCAVACASYDERHNACEDDSACVTGRICCQDPCPNSPLKLCFPDIGPQVPQ